ncbi:MAG: hypothetical protein FJZ63_00115 [Chlamydiae bacterium]|nr:hypothetical protein [Chlamydiota bacterium]
MSLLEVASSFNPFFTYLFLNPTTHPCEKTSLPSLEEKSFLEKKVKELAGKMGLSKPVEIVYTAVSLTPFSVSPQSIFSDKNIIHIAPETIKAVNLAPPEMEFLLGHELAHIKKNDILTTLALRLTVAAICTVAFAWLFPAANIFFVSTLMAPLVPISCAALAGHLSGTLASALYMRFIESRADKLGWEYSSLEGKRAAPSFFKKIIDFQLKTRNNSSTPLSLFIRKLLISEEGNSRIDIVHPPLTERVRYLTELNNATRHAMQAPAY